MSSETDYAFVEELSKLENMLVDHRRLKHLYLPNAPLPSPSEIEIIKYLISSVEDLTSTINRSVMSKHPRYQARVEHAVKEAQKYSLEHRRLVSPLRRIPVQIMQNIFVYTAQASGSLPNDDLPGNTLVLGRPPLELAQVCHAWRRIARGTQKLWRALPPIDLDKKHTEDSRYVTFLSTLIFCSDPLPISFILRGSNFTSISHPVTRLLAQNAKRWGLVALKIPLKGFRALEAGRGRFSALTSLSIDWGDCKEQDCQGAYDLFADATSLRNIRLRRGAVGSVVLPYKNVASFKVRGGVQMGLGDVLSASPRLKTLDIMDITGDQNMSMDEGDAGDVRLGTELSELTSLRICRVGYESLVKPLMEGLLSPKLSELQILLASDASSFVLWSTVRMLDRSRPATGSSLTHLCLRCWFQKQGEFQQLLHILPCLTHLNITLPGPMDIIQLCGSESHDENKWLLLPRLEVCVFRIEQSKAMTVSDNLIKAINCLARARCDLKEIYQFAASSRNAIESHLSVACVKKRKKDARTLLRALYIALPGSLAVALQGRLRAVCDEFQGDGENKRVGHDEGEGVDETVKEKIRVCYEPDVEHQVDFQRNNCKIVYLSKTNGMFVSRLF